MGKKWYIQPIKHGLSQQNSRGLFCHSERMRLKKSKYNTEHQLH